tara:strand:+ start:1255 stop:1704 length:450 start_codon:yes stop_codon:yes gene_type:complete
MKYLNKNSIYIGWSDNIQLAIDAYEDMVELNEENKDVISNLEQSVRDHKSLIKTLDEDIEMYKNTKKELLLEIKHLSQLNGEYRRERHDMEDKLIEATKPWYLKLKNKLTKLSLRNPFYIKSSTSSDFQESIVMKYDEENDKIIYEDAS